MVASLDPLSIAAGTAGAIPLQIVVRFPVAVFALLLLMRSQPLRLPVSAQAQRDHLQRDFFRFLPEHVSQQQNADEARYRFDVQRVRIAWVVIVCDPLTAELVAPALHRRHLSIA